MVEREKQDFHGMVEREKQEFDGMVESEKQEGLWDIGWEGDSEDQTQSSQRERDEESQWKESSLINIVTWSLAAMLLVVML